MNIEHFLEKRKALAYDGIFDSHKFPIFVTYYLDGRLRGCIGTFKEDALG